MSQHNIIGSEAFNRRPFILIRNFRSNGLRRRRASTTLAYMIVAGVALIIGAVIVALVMGPQLADAQARGADPSLDRPTLSAPAVPGRSLATPAESAAPAAPSAQAPQAAL